MKLFLSAFAITALSIGAALALPLSAGDAERVRRIVPDANLTMLSAEQSDLLSTFVNSGDFGRSPSDAEYIRAILSGNLSGNAAPVMLTTGDRERITNLIPSADLDKLSEDQVRMLSTFVNGAQYSQSPSAQTYVAAVLAGEVSMTPAAPGMLSSSDAMRIRLLLPNAELDTLTAAQAASLSTFVNSADYGRSPSDAEYLRSILNS